jgi:hypothetical protein
MTVEVIYARVPPALKADVATYAERTGVNLNSAVADLLECGLEMRAFELADAGPEHKLADLRETISKLETTLATQGRELSRLEGQRQDFAAAAEGATARLEQAVARCPACRQPVSGSDVLVRGVCQRCHKPLSSLLTDDRVQLNQSDYMVLIGAVGVLLALSLWQAKQA